MFPAFGSKMRNWAGDAIFGPQTKSSRQNSHDNLEPSHRAGGAQLLKGNYLGLSPAFRIFQQDTRTWQHFLAAAVNASQRFICVGMQEPDSYG